MQKNETIPKIPLYDFKTKTLKEEHIFQQKLLTAIYGTKWGRFLVTVLLRRRIFSALYGAYCNSSLSKQKINRALKGYDFRVHEINDPLDHFKTFNAFFTRTLKEGARPLHPSKHHLISPADARLLVYPIQDTLVIPIKGASFLLSDLLKDKALAKTFDEGLCLVFRLAPVDYHRFIYFDAGHHGPCVDLTGRYHSVHPYALWQNLPIFTENKRNYTLLHTQNFDDVLYMEIGALLVGRIVQRLPNGGTFDRGQEKGLFEFGGSTLVLLFKKNTITLHEDILHHSEKGIETQIELGTSIGTKFSQPTF